MVAGSVDALTRDLRSAVRRLSRARTLSTIVVLSLALGIGANTAIFSVARSILVVHVPYQDPDRVVLVETYAMFTRRAPKAKPSSSSVWLALSSESRRSRVNISTGGVVIPRCGCRESNAVLHGIT